jgi:hypothetical protein
LQYASFTTDAEKKGRTAFFRRKLAEKGCGLTDEPLLAAVFAS